MSANANTLPDGQTAYNNLLAGAHQQVFFRKCAAAGYVPNNANEAQWMLEIAGKLRMAEQAQPVKTAADQQSPYFQANQALDRVLAHYGIAAPTKQANDNDHALRQAAEYLSNDPILYNSILALKTAEAVEIQQQYERSRAVAR